MSTDQIAVSWMRAIHLSIDRTVECLELLDEVKALDEELGIVRRSYEHLLGECSRLKGENALLFSELERFIAARRTRQWVQPS